MIILDPFQNSGARARLQLMKQVVEKSLQKAQKHQKTKDGVLRFSTLVLNLKDIGNAVLAPQPPAAMAWSGICAIIPVSSDKSV